MKNRNSYERLKSIQASLSELSKSLDEQYYKMRQECINEIIEDRKEYVTKKKMKCIHCMRKFLKAIL